MRGSLFILMSVWLMASCAASNPSVEPEGQTVTSERKLPSAYHLVRRRPIETYRLSRPTPTPDRFRKIPGRIGEVLVEKHLYKDGPVWGLAKRDPSATQPYDEVGSLTFYNYVQQYQLWDRVPPLDDAARAKALAFWQSWQDPQTGRFIDPRDPGRLVPEKYILGIIQNFGGRPVYLLKDSSQMATRDAAGKIDTRAFLGRTLDDPDWADGGWGVGSHTGLMAVQILEAVNQGQTELIPDLEKGLQQIFAHQDPDGFWGPPTGSLIGRLGGTLKLISRLYHRMGMNIPRTRELADTLIRHEQNGDWYRIGDNFCVPQNILILVDYCLETSDYRRDELLAVVEAKAREYQEWVLPDGSMLIRRGDPTSVGVENVHMQALGIIGSILNWTDCPMSNPFIAGPQAPDFSQYRYRAVVLKDGSVKVIDTRQSS